MNLVKVAELLKNAPDQALMQELNNPNGAAPSYMVLSELQRRKKLRGSLMNNEPQSSVAEDLEAESAQAPQMGLGSMSQAPMQQAPQQAPVGMASGGEVVHAAGGWWEDPSQYSNFDPTNPKMQRSRLDEMRAAIRDQYGVDPENLGTMTSIGQGLGNLFGSGSAQNQALNEYESAKKGLSLLQTAPTKAAPAPAPSPAGPPQGRPQGRPAAPTGGLPTLAPQKANSDDYSVNPLLSELKGYRNQMAEAYKNQADVYKQQADEIKNAKSSDVALALMQAGFGIMGGESQYAARNIGQGAMPAIQQYAGMDRARREQLQKLALGQGALGIEQLGAQMKGVTAEGELGLGGEKMDIARRSAAADEMRARASMAAVGNQAAQWKMDNAKDKVDQQRAATLINYLKTDGINLDEPTKAQYVSEINRLLRVGSAPQNKLSGNAKEGYKYGYN